MPAIYLQYPLPPHELATIKKEFPHYDFIQKCETPAEWSSVEILYGNQLSENELKLAPRLRWIHCHSTDTHALCLPEIQKEEHIIVTISKGANVPQIAEFVLGAMLTFSKQFLHWTQAPHDSAEFWEWPLKETMWTLHNKQLLQIGLGEVGTAIVKMANELGMKSWGIRKERSFHPYCHKTFSLNNLHSLLPNSDVVVMALPHKGIKEVLFKQEEFELMKHDSIFIVVGSGDFVDEKALAEVAKRGKFRGILLDSFRRQAPPSKKSPLWSLPNCILTPSVASYPESSEHLAYRLFRNNLRVFILERINEMKNRVL